jgi:hypothetical protein
MSYNAWHCHALLPRVALAVQPLCWQIDNARWYAIDPASPCNDTADYLITCSVNANGLIFQSNSIFTVKATCGSITETDVCMAGESRITDLWAGDIAVYYAKFPDGTWGAIFSPGDFRREIKTTTTIRCNPNSQFYDMIVAEENFHKGQFEGTTSNIYDDLWNPNKVIEYILWHSPYSGVSEEDVKSQFEQTEYDAKRIEWTRSYNLFLARECEKEREAKTAVKSSHRVSLQCTYPECSN